MNREIKPLPSKSPDDILGLIYKIKEGEFIAFYPTQGNNYQWIAVEKRVQGDEVLFIRYEYGEGRMDLETEEDVDQVAKDVAQANYNFYEVGNIQGYVKASRYHYDDDQGIGDYETNGPDRLTWADIRESKISVEELKEIIKSLIRENLGYSHAIIKPQPEKDPVTETNKPFYENLSETLAAVEQFIESNKIVIDPSEHKQSEADKYGIRQPYMYGGIGYEQHKDTHYKLLQYKGKPTKKYLHISIYRMPTGRYELTNYVS